MAGSRPFLCLLIICLGLLAQLGPSLADKRVALVVGNANYKNTAALSNPGNDATDVAQALRAIGFEVTLKLDAEKRQMDQAIAQFARDATSADAAFFYYSGHGMQFQGSNYVMPVDAELQDEISLRYEMTAVDDVKAALERSSGVKIMVLDSCRNNPLAAKLVRSISVKTRDVPNVQGFARPEKTRGMIIVYATQSDDVANDGTGRNSPFSAAFLKEIKEPGLEIGTMFRRVGGDVYQATDGAQSPELSISLVPEYYLNQAETDQSIWARIRGSADAGTIREFLSRYPKSFYAPDARARLDLLDREVRESTDNQTQKQSQDAEVARLKAVQAERDRAAQEAQAQEQDLAAKLAAAEAERQKLAAELAQREAAQDAAETRRRADLEQSEADRRQRESELRTQVEQKTATADQPEKDRALREALDQDRAEQAKTLQAKEEGERAVNENAERVLKSESDRAQALKTEIAELELQAAQAKVAALAEVQKASEAKKATDPSENKPSSSSVAGVALGPEQIALVGPIQTELRRLGCYGGSGEWASVEMQRGVARYTRYAKLASLPDAPTAELLDGLKGQRERVCPSECSPRETEVGGRCVAKSCGAGERLSKNGQCAPKLAPTPRVASSHDAPSARAATATPKGHCFNFNGNQYCE